MNKIVDGATAALPVMDPAPYEVAMYGAPLGLHAARRMLRPVETPAPTPVDFDLGLRRSREPALEAAVIVVDAARPVDDDDGSGYKVLLVTAMSVAMAFALGRSGWYTSGDDVGYYLGLAGGIVLLVLLTYPLRKYIKAFRNWGAVKYWFEVHMVLGIGGPVLVLAHSTFHMRSTNATVALICMLVVAGSGIIGRFLYTQVHRGLYGEKLNMSELRAHAGFEDEEVRSKLHFVPTVEARLKKFEIYAMPAYRNRLQDTWRFVSLGARRFITHRRCMAELALALRQSAATHIWNTAKFRAQLRDAEKLVNEYLASVQRVSQFTVYDRLLQMWHLAHVPLVYLLVLSSIAHVVAVHMY